MEGFNVFYSALIKELSHFNLDLEEHKKFIIELTATLDANFDNAYNRCAYMYRYSTCNTYFLKECIENFMTDASSKDLKTFLNTIPDIKICSLTTGPGLDFLAFAMAVSSHIKESNFSSVHVLTKCGAWRNTVGFISSCLQGASIIDSNIKLNYKNIEVVQGDMFKGFPSKWTTPVSNAQVFLMLKILNLTAPDPSVEAPTLTSLSEFISVLEPKSVIFCIDTKPSVDLFTKALVRFSGKFSFGPLPVNSRLPENFPQYYNIIHGTFPVVTSRGMFFVWQKVAHNPKPQTSSPMKFVPLPLENLLKCDFLTPKMDMVDPHFMKSEAECYNKLMLTDSSISNASNLSKEIIEIQESTNSLAVPSVKLIPKEPSAENIRINETIVPIGSTFEPLSDICTLQTQSVTDTCTKNPESQENSHKSKDLSLQFLSLTELPETIVEILKPTSESFDDSNSIPIENNTENNWTKVQLKTSNKTKSVIGIEKSVDVCPGVRSTAIQTFPVVDDSSSIKNKGIKVLTEIGAELSIKNNQINENKTDSRNSKDVLRPQTLAELHKATVVKGLFKHSSESVENSNSCGIKNSAENKQTPTKYNIKQKVEKNSEYSVDVCPAVSSTAVQTIPVASENNSSSNNAIKELTERIKNLVSCFESDLQQNPVSPNDGHGNLSQCQAYNSEVGNNCTIANQRDQSCHTNVTCCRMCNPNRVSLCCCHVPAVVSNCCNHSTLNYCACNVTQRCCRPCSYNTQPSYLQNNVETPSIVIPLQNVPKDLLTTLFSSVRTSSKDD